MKVIIIAAGQRSRLGELTKNVNGKLLKIKGLTDLTFIWAIQNLRPNYLRVICSFYA